MTGALSMIMLDQTVVTVALPVMSRDLGLSPTGQQWVVNAYVLAMAALVALGGKLGDRFGGATIFRIGVVVFFVGSAFCGLAPAGDLGETWIIASRLVQGAGAALMMPVSAAIVMSAFPQSERGRAMAIYAGISQVFLAVGPLLGGALTEAASWRLVFWLNVPVGLLALLLVRIARPSDARHPEMTVRTGPVLMLVGGVGLSIVAIQQSSVWGWTSPATTVSLGLGLLLLMAFGVTSLRSAQPLVNVRLFARPAFAGDLVVLGLVQFGLLAVVLYGSLYMQDLLELSPMAAGAAILPMILALAAAAQLGGRWYDRAGVRPPVLIGLALAFVGLLAWAASLPRLEYVPQIPGMVLAGLGLGLIMSPANTDALARVSAADRSQASGLVQTIRQLGGTLGVAIIGAVVLGIEHDGTGAASSDHAANAIAVGYVCSAAVFALALVAGWWTLSRERVAADETMGVAVG